MNIKNINQLKPKNNQPINQKIEINCLAKPKIIRQKIENNGLTKPTF